MSHRNRGGIFISLLGLLGILIVIAGISMLIGSKGNLAIIVISIIPIAIGGGIVYEVIKSQKEK